MKKISSETPLDGAGRQYHIGCRRGDMAEFVIFVGDPKRAAAVAGRFDDIRFETQHREFVTKTGTFKGVEITVMGTGIGQGNTEIAVVETCQITDAPTFIRCGSCGSLKAEPELGDLILTRAAMGLGNVTRYYVREGYPAAADSDVLLALGAACRKLNKKFHVGITAAAPGFFGSQGREAPGFPVRYPDLQEELARMNVVNFEMETEPLFTLASLRGVRAGAVCTVFANRVRKEFADERTRVRGQKDAIDVSLEAFRILKTMDAQRRRAGTPIWLPEIPRKA